MIKYCDIIMLKTFLIASTHCCIGDYYGLWLILNLCDFSTSISFSFHFESPCYLFIGVEVFRSTYFGMGTGPILYAYLNCDGTETALADCSTSYSFPFSVSHSSDAGVRCTRNTVNSKNFIRYICDYMH